jgi:hypothetical protein
MAAPRIGMRTASMAGPHERVRAGTHERPTPGYNLTGSASRNRCGAQTFDHAEAVVVSCNATDNVIHLFPKCFCCFECGNHILQLNDCAESSTRIAQRARRGAQDIVSEFPPVSSLVALTQQRTLT